MDKVCVTRMDRVCVTGAAGFVGSHIVEYFLRRYPGVEITAFDSLTYAGNLDNLSGVLRDPRVRFIEASIVDPRAVHSALAGVDVVIHAAAESHVDNSYRDPGLFIDTNIHGTTILLEAAVAHDLGLFVHISTDEIYGDTQEANLTEDARPSPTNPYAASKAGAEMMLKAYMRSYGLRAICLRANNIYGTRQYPEKLIPKAIMAAARGMPFQVHGSGMQRRAFLHAFDFCEAIEAVIRRGARGATYNVGGEQEFTVLEVLGLVATALNTRLEDFVVTGTDRPYNDSRYGLICSRLKRLGWQQRHSLEADMPALVDWYTRHVDTRARQYEFPFDDVRSATVNGAAHVIGAAQAAVNGAAHVVGAAQAAVHSGA